MSAEALLIGAAVQRDDAAVTRLLLAIAAIELHGPPAVDCGLPCEDRSGIRKYQRTLARVFRLRLRLWIGLWRRLTANEPGVRPVGVVERTDYPRRRDDQPELAHPGNEYRQRARGLVPFITPLSTRRSPSAHT